MLPPPPIFAFGITNLPMLGWLAAGAAPILIHLWSRRRYRETSWAAMEYLLAAFKRQTRRIQLEQLLLLIVRTLLVALVVLAVAQPYLEQSRFVLPAAGRTHRVLVIDGSFSMAYQPKDDSRFEQAKKLARQIVEESRQGDAFTLVLASLPPRVVVARPVFEPREFLQEIDNLQLPHTTADFPATLVSVEGLLETARRESPRLTADEIYFLTDLQRSAWLVDSADVMAEFRKRAKRLAESVALVVIDLGQPNAENLAVGDLRSLEPLIAPHQNVNLEVTLKNFGRRDRTRVPVELLVDGRAVSQRRVDLPGRSSSNRPAGEATFTFSCQFETPGDHTVEVRTAGDSLEIDNRRWMAIPVRQSVRVLCINGRPSGEPFGGATDYLVFALWPRDDRAEQARVETDVAPESALLERELAGYDCVFLCDVAQFTSSEARVLDAYLTGGGSLVFFLGDQVLADRYNRELGGEDGGARVLPAVLGSVVEVPEYQPLDPLEYRHPIVRAFRGRPGSGLLSTPVTRYFKLRLAGDSKAKVVLATAGGDPLIVEEPLRRGRSVLVATSASDAEWTSMPMWPSYLPLVQEILAYCLSGQLRQRNLLVGQSLGASVPAPAADVPLVIGRPDGATRQLRVRPDSDYSTFSYADTTTSGIYTARFGPPVNRDLSFAVNVDPAEGDLTQLGRQQLRNEVWPGIDFDYQTTWQKPDGQPGVSIHRPGHLHVVLLYLVLGLLFLETLLAWRFGHHTS